MFVILYLFKKYCNWLKFIKLRVTKVLVSETRSGIVRIKKLFSKNNISYKCGNMPR